MLHHVTFTKKFQVFEASSIQQNTVGRELFQNSRIHVNSTNSEKQRVNIRVQTSPQIKWPFANQKRSAHQSPHKEIFKHFLWKSNFSSFRLTVRVKMNGVPHRGNIFVKLIYKHFIVIYPHFNLQFMSRWTVCLRGALMLLFFTTQVNSECKSDLEILMRNTERHVILNYIINDNLKIRSYGALSKKTVIIQDLKRIFSGGKRIKVVFLT